MRDFINRVKRIGAVASAVAAAMVLGGCSLSGAGAPQSGAATGPPVTITQHVPASALLMVTDGPASGPSLSGLVAATAGPNEDISILASGTPASTVVAADSPRPTTIVLAGAPAAPGNGATAYQSAQYARKLKAWRAKRAAEVLAEAAQTRGRVSAWVGGLSIGGKVGQLGDPPADEGSLSAESAVAASAQTGLAAGAEDAFGSRRVIVLFCDSLGGELPAGELTGDDVIVVTSYLPTAADASAAQAALLEAGAALAAVVGPSVTSGQVDALVSAGLAGTARRGWVSGAVLFGNASYALSPVAAGSLGQLLPRLKEPGATAVINGFTSTPGTAEGNYVLSFERATAVAGFFEAHGVAASSMILVGHGAGNPVGAGDSAANRRVLVVIEEPGG
jgi:outer membrane protein OmpA-like peptidoglycan-associated protein